MSDYLDSEDRADEQAMNDGDELQAIVFDADETGGIMELCEKHQLGYIKMAPINPFVVTMLELSAVGQGDLSSFLPTFRLRLDLNGKTVEERPGQTRLLVRPVETPMMHEEVKLVTEVAERNGLSCSVTQAGIVIHRPESPPQS